MDRKLWDNLLSLLCVQALNYIAPLITLPLLARVLGPGNWGKLAFAEAYAAYVSVIVEYGFGLSATRAVAEASDDVDLRSSLLSGVLTAQAMLAIACGSASIVLVRLLSSMHPYASLIPLALLLAVFRAFTPLWYFQGLEKMRLIAVLNIAVNLSSACFIIAIVRSPTQTWVPLAIRALAAFMAAGAAFGIAYRDVHFTRPKFSRAWNALKDGWSIFLFKSAVSLYTTGNVLLLGFLAPATVVAWFAGAERIVKAGMSAFGPITQTFYPRISSLLKTDPSQARSTARLSVQFTVGAGILVGVVIFATAPFLVRVLLGQSFGPSSSVLRCLSVLPPLAAASTVLGIQWMLPLRLDSTYTKIIFLGGLINIALAIVLAPHYKAMGMAFSIAAAELFVAISVFATLRRKGLDPWNSGAAPDSIKFGDVPLT